ncbi:Ubiquinone/menaquinone biosynthesis C-methyltransferase UbiE [Podospora aff. communis PSN243]|uniref:Ubiquinone/menaquinone biosynthesis C-methyltransferase UbiE n=1 Tax=Podospora aff. communis PSN243 TaxID=3040156 RepID=A0AAV9GUL0_9PEZI|nr:Ubiquinone/menaquinone biosynthesis C-methyltransferase UbiE [Podospora aff. communis PSN243]
MASPDTSRKQYDNVATAYTSVEDLPCSKIEAELIRTALGDCTGLSVLDLGGGSGLHARRAVDAGAASVDVLDISVEMMKVGQDIEVSLGRGDKIKWVAADLGRPLGEQDAAKELKSEGYDIVMANWLFDHATSVEDLKAMWGNVVANLKPGGRFLGVRVKNVHTEFMTYGKYGASFSEIVEIPGGYGYNCNCLTQPPFSFGCTSMADSYTLANEIPKGLGLVDFEVLKPEDTDVAKGDPEFWKDFVADPNLAVVTARKPSS